MQPLQLYVPGRWAAQTAKDNEYLLQCALPGWVFVMRREGRRLPARRVDAPREALVLPIDRYGGPETFLARLYAPDNLADHVAELHSARQLRADRGARLIRGDEYNFALGQHFPQTWLSTSTAERGWEILRAMAAAEGSHE